MLARSCLYECEIWHERTAPRYHAFTAKHFMMCLDLDELTLQPPNAKLLSVNKFNVFSFSERDYLAGKPLGVHSLKDRVKATVRRLGVNKSINRIELVTNVRIFGYVFNPVSFYFCFGEENDLIGCLCEVGNTFGEKKLFLVKSAPCRTMTERQTKYFYVSPFTKLDQDFDFKISPPGEKLDIKINTMDGDTAIVKASLKGTRLTLNDANLIRLLRRHSWATVKVIALIHLHAVMLWLKKVPYHQKEESTELQVDILNPRSKTRSCSTR